MSRSLTHLPAAALPVLLDLWFGFAPFAKPDMHNIYSIKK